MKLEQFLSKMDDAFAEVRQVYGEGHKEYAHADDEVFANFMRGASDIGMDRKLVLWVYAMKHKDGISAYLQGHKSQREDVRGRIKDLICYLVLLRAMIDEEEGGEKFLEPKKKKEKPLKVGDWYWSEFVGQALQVQPIDIAEGIAGRRRRATPEEIKAAQA